MDQDGRKEVGDSEQIERPLDMPQQGTTWVFKILQEKEPMISLLEIWNDPMISLLEIW